MANVKTNKAKKEPKKVKSDATDNKSIPNTEKNPRYTIRQISNGWLVDKSWTDKDDKYHSEEIYHKDKPDGLDAMVSEEDDD
jgi:hypothetical protein